MKKGKKRNLQGTVLFTTVSVMALLILFLVGTLALASASNNRAHKTYSSTQANYTAKAAIDGFTTAMSRNANVAAAVESLADPSSAGSVIYPEIQMSANSLGHIGCYDNTTGAWRENEIKVESISGNAYEYMDDDGAASFGDTGAKWVKLERVRVSATVRVGKEEETVVAYIQKRPRTDTTITTFNGTQVKGIQMTGNAGFPAGHLVTGGLGIALSEVAGSSVTKLRNEMNIETSLSFINSDIVWNTSEMVITVKKPDALDKDGNAVDPTLPYSQTVVNGSLYMHNNSPMIHLDYDMPSGYTHDWSVKEVPYLYIDGAFTSPQTELNIVTRTASCGDVPFNFFVGTYNSPGIPKMANTNLYLMDEYDASKVYTVYDDCERHVVDNVDYYTGPAGTAHTITAGDNVLCGTQDGVLRDWVTSVADGNLTTGYNVGGNIYCNGNLTLKGMEIDGDVCVKGNCTIESGVTIHGRLVVGGTLTGEDSATISGGAYRITGGGSAASTSIEPLRVENKEKDAVPPVDTTTLTPIDDLNVNYFAWVPGDHLDENGIAVDPWGKNVDVNESDPYYDPDPAVVNRSSVRYYRWNNDYRNGQSFALTDLDTIGTRTYVELDADDTFKNIRSYLVDAPLKAEGDSFYNAVPVLEGDAIVLSGESAPDGETYFFDPDGARILSQTQIDDINSGASTVKEYWRVQSDGVTVTADDAPDHDAKDHQYTYYKQDASGNLTGEYSFDHDVMVTPGAPGGGGSSTTLLSLGMKEIYPSDMTREKIYGHYDDAGAFIPAEDDTRIIVNIKEARESLGLDPETGVPDVAKYPTSFPDTKVMPEVPTEEWDGTSTITSSIVITGGPYRDRDIIVEPPDGGTINIILRDLEVGNNHYIQVRSGGNVNFIFDGKVTFRGGGIKPASYNNDNGNIPEFDHNKDWGIVYYGYADSMLILSDSNCLVVGAFKCPGTEFVNHVEGAHIKVKYLDENGTLHEPGVGKYHKANGSEATEPYPCIVGNALFKSVVSQNLLENYYTASGSGLTGSGSGATTTIKTELGYYDIMYWGAA